jgi:hypothetical protein
MENEIKNLSEDEFYNSFILMDNKFDSNASFDGKMYETYGEELKFVLEMAKQNRVITIIEGDGFCENNLTENEEEICNIYYVTGYHIVNRLGFLILDTPYEHEFEVKLD